MFEFMMEACMDTCGWAKERVTINFPMKAMIHIYIYLQGCVDEHPRCTEWARLGLCNAAPLAKVPLFMAHTCRESCGVCGFLSHLNNEEQVNIEYSSRHKMASSLPCYDHRRCSSSIAIPIVIITTLLNKSMLVW